eukprot:3026522-Pyramimonas_sp.AAC.1
MRANTAAEAFGGAPSGPTKRCTGRRKRMRTPPLGSSVGLLVVPRSAVLGGGMHADTTTGAVG